MTEELKHLRENGNHSTDYQILLLFALFLLYFLIENIVYVQYYVS